jgi:hypothetical protein
MSFVWLFLIMAAYAALSFHHSPPLVLVESYIPICFCLLFCSTKLTEDNFEKTVQAEIDAGKTFFVRWIASAG